MVVGADELCRWWRVHGRVEPAPARRSLMDRIREKFSRRVGDVVTAVVVSLLSQRSAFAVFCLRFLQSFASFALFLVRSR